MSVHLPAAEKVRTLFADLLDREVAAAPAPGVAPGVGAPASVATYVDDQDRPSAVVACDLPLSARAGAAIGLVPSSGAERAILSGCLDGTLLDNLREVLDVAATMFNVEGSSHLHLDDLHAAGGELPGDVQTRALTLGRRVDLELDITGYGAGRLSVVLL